MWHFQIKFAEKHTKNSFPSYFLRLIEGILFFMNQQCFMIPWPHNYVYLFVSLILFQTSCVSNIKHFTPFINLYIRVSHILLKTVIEKKTIFQEKYLFFSKICDDAWGAWMQLHWVIYLMARMGFWQKQLN